VNREFHPQGITSPPGKKFTPGGQLCTWGQSLPPNEVKDGPQFSEGSGTVPLFGRWCICIPKIPLLVPTYVHIFWRVLVMIMVVHFLAYWNILKQFGIFYGRLVYLVVIGYIHTHFGMLHQGKSGNPGRDVQNYVDSETLTKNRHRIKIHMWKGGGIVKFHLSSCLKGELSWGNWLRHFSSLRGSAVRN
jgi:hypothetical protein